MERLYETRGKIDRKEKKNISEEEMEDILQELDGLISRIEEGSAKEQNARMSLRRVNNALELLQDKRDKTMQEKQRKSEITVSKFIEQAVSEMVRARTGIYRDGWEIHRSWKAFRIEGVRILHAYKRQKVVREAA